MAHWHPGPVFREKWFARQSRGARRIEFYAFSASISPPRTRQTMLVAVERGVKQALEAWDNLRLAAWEQCRPRLHLHHCHDLHAVRSVSALTLTLAASFRAQLPKQMTGKMVCNVCVFFWLSWSVARVDHLRSGMIFTNQYKSDIWWGLPISSDSFCSEVKSIRTSSHSRYFTTKHVGPMLASESLSSGRTPRHHGLLAVQHSSGALRPRPDAWSILELCFCNGLQYTFCNVFSLLLVL